MRLQFSFLSIFPLKRVKNMIGYIKRNYIFPIIQSLIHSATGLFQQNKMSRLHFDEALLVYFDSLWHFPSIDNILCRRFLFFFSLENSTFCTYCKVNTKNYLSVVISRIVDFSVVSFGIKEYWKWWYQWKELYVCVATSGIVQFVNHIERLIVAN